MHEKRLVGDLGVSWGALQRFWKKSKMYKLRTPLVSEHEIFALELKNFSPSLSSTEFLEQGLRQLDMEVSRLLYLWPQPFLQMKQFSPGLCSRETR